MGLSQPPEWNADLSPIIQANKLSHMLGRLSSKATNYGEEEERGGEGRTPFFSNDFYFSKNEVSIQD